MYIYCYTNVLYFLNKTKKNLYSTSNFDNNTYTIDIVTHYTHKNDMFYSIVIPIRIVIESIIEILRHCNH